MITQGLYCLVFLTRYLDLFWRPPASSYYLFIGKVFYIVTAIYILALMQWVYPRSREREKAWRLGTCCLVGSLIGAPIVHYILYPEYWNLISEVGVIFMGMNVNR
jgi:ER lumen protein retaining receptor